MSFTDRISGSVCYIQTMYLEGSKSLRNTHGEVNCIFQALNEHYHDTVLYDSEAAADIPAFRDIRTAQNFLHGGGLPFRAERLLIRDFSIHDDVIPIIDSHVMAVAYPEMGSVSVMVNLCIKDIDTESLVFMRHMQGNGKKLTITAPDGSTRSMTISEITNEVISHMCVTLGGHQGGYLLELNNFCGYEHISDILESEPNRLYGIMTGDEGWEYLAKDLAEERVASRWSSRSFVSMIAFGNAFLLLNLFGSPEYTDYLTHQKRFFTEYYQAENPYFTLRAPIAGVNHGIFFAAEVGLLIKTFSQNVLDRQDSWIKGKLSFSTKISEMKDIRKDLIMAIGQVEDLGISEIGELQSLVMQSLKIHPVIDRLKNLLDILESGLELHYSTHTNFFVNLLAIIGLLFSLIELCSMFFG